MNYNTDIRIDINLHECGKFLALEEDIGIGAMRYLTRLWCATARQYPDGILRGCTAKAVAALAGVTDAPEDFVNLLIKHRWLDKKAGGYVIHDWREHQPWVAGAPTRSEIARKAGIASGKARRKKSNIGRTDGNGDEQTRTEGEQPVRAQIGA